ncbi:MAG TPA: hypothetical protein VGS07_00875 [Thermoanaerobaculia bacterium]|jgi:hypothetical protein|nr:hypothetical protein [Thermoanaerobaculia bacterium]
MTKKVLNTVKATLLAATLLITGLAFYPQMAAAAAGDITIFCVGPPVLCATYEDDNVIIDFYLGRAALVIIEM